MALQEKLSRTVYSLLDIVSEYLQSCDLGIAKEVIVVRNDIAYLSNIFARFIKLNLSLQGSKVNLIEVKSALSGFNNKLVVYQRNLVRQEFFLILTLETT